jgi:uncharacterized membrane-anchored protein
MSTAFTRGLIVLGALLVLVSVNHAIYRKERIIHSGETIYLALAPLDPRSLMQGDYMALRFQLAASIGTVRYAASTEFSAPLQLDQRRVASLGTAADALRIRYRIRNGQVWLGTNAYFFEEGSGDRFAAAKFGEFRLDRDSGEAVLVSLRDVQLRKL